MSLIELNFAIARDWAADAEECMEIAISELHKAVQHLDAALVNHHELRAYLERDGHEETGCTDI